MRASSSSWCANHTKKHTKNMQKPQTFAIFKFYWYIICRHSRPQSLADSVVNSISFFNYLFNSVENFTLFLCCFLHFTRCYLILFDVSWFLDEVLRNWLTFSLIDFTKYSFIFSCQSNKIQRNKIIVDRVQFDSERLVFSKIGENL